MMDRANEFGEIHSGLSSLKSDGWEGRAADHFRSKFKVQTKGWLDAQEAFSSASEAYSSYASALASAQGQCDEIRSRWKQGRDAVQQAQNNQADARSQAAAEGGIPMFDASCDEGPGRSAMAAAVADFETLVGQVNEASDLLITALDAGIAKLPERTWWDSVKRTVGSVVTGFVEAVADLVKLGLALSGVPMLFDFGRMLMGQMTLDEFCAKHSTIPMETIAGLAKALWEDPGAFFAGLGKAIVDWDTWTDDPGRAIGHLLPDVLIAIATAGTGTAASAGEKATSGAARLARMAHIGKEVFKAVLPVSPDDVRALGKLGKNLFTKFTHHGVDAADTVAKLCADARKQVSGLRGGHLMADANKYSDVGHLSGNASHGANNLAGLDHLSGRSSHVGGGAHDLAGASDLAGDASHAGRGTNNGGLSRTGTPDPGLAGAEPGHQGHRWNNDPGAASSREGASGAGTSHTSNGAASHASPSAHGTSEGLSDSPAQNNFAGNQSAAATPGNGKSTVTPNDVDLAGSSSVANGQTQGRNDLVGALTGSGDASAGAHRSSDMTSALSSGGDASHGVSGIGGTTDVGASTSHGATGASTPTASTNLGGEARNTPHASGMEGTTTGQGHPSNGAADSTHGGSGPTTSHNTQGAPRGASHEPPQGGSQGASRDVSSSGGHGNQPQNPHATQGGNTSGAQRGSSSNGSSSAQGHDGSNQGTQGSPQPTNPTAPKHPTAGDAPAPQRSQAAVSGEATHGREATTPRSAAHSHAPDADGAHATTREPAGKGKVDETPATAEKPTTEHHAGDKADSNAGEKRSGNEADADNTHAHDSAHGQEPETKPGKKSEGPAGTKTHDEADKADNHASEDGTPDKKDANATHHDGDNHAKEHGSNPDKDSDRPKDADGDGNSDKDSVERNDGDPKAEDYSANGNADDADAHKTTEDAPEAKADDADTKSAASDGHGSGDGHGDGERPLTKEEIEALPQAPGRRASEEEVNAWLDACIEQNPDLTRQELMAAYDYSGPQYKEINGWLRDPSMAVSADIPETVETLNKFLDRLPPHNGRVYRGTKVPGHMLDEALRTGIYRDPAFFSSSTKPGVAEKFMNSGALDPGDRRVLFEIESASGSNIRPMSMFATQDEILFKSGLEFKIEKWTEHADGSYTIKLRQRE